MVVRLVNGDRINVLSLADLASMIPPDRDGEALNYGQGEGQFRVEGTEWGYYCAPYDRLQFEGGSVSPSFLFELLSSIVAQIQCRWGPEISAIVDGACNDEGQ